MKKDCHQHILLPQLLRRLTILNTNARNPPSFPCHYLAMPCCLKFGDLCIDDLSMSELSGFADVDAQAKETRKDAKAAWQVALSEWQKMEDEQKELKIRETAKHKDAMEAWKAENSQGRGRGRGRRRGRGGGVTKAPQPVMATIPKQMPQPLLKNFLAGGSDEQLGSSSNEGSGNDEGSSSDEEE